MSHVFGYCVHTDYSEREFQLERGGQWVKGKSADTFAPLGPYRVTKDEIQNPHKLRLWLKVNGETRQDSNPSDLIFSVSCLVSYISQFMSNNGGNASLVSDRISNLSMAAALSACFSLRRFISLCPVLKIDVSTD